jgi:Cu-Zn family superoxide dismutase
MKLRQSGPIVLLAVGWALFAGCGQPADDAQAVAEEPEPQALETPRGAPYAAAKLEPTQGHETRGTVTFYAEDELVDVVVYVEGLEPGTHGFHIHEFGDCSAPDASSAGGHFAPLGSPHGPPQAGKGERHVGDLGNIVADSSGTAQQVLSDRVIRLDGEHSILGKAVVVHADADDFTTQPTGAAGARLACGVIERWQTAPETQPD